MIAAAGSMGLQPGKHDFFLAVLGQEGRKARQLRPSREAPGGNDDPLAGQ
jgi:hypothetical protein